MRHLLPPVRAAIEHEPVSSHERLRRGQRFRHQKEMPDQIDILGLHMFVTHNRLPWDYQDMGRRLRINVTNRETQLVLVNKVSRDLTVGNSLKKCFLRHRTWV